MSQPMDEHKTVINVTRCLFCYHHREEHNPKGCGLCPCPKRNLPDHKRKAKRQAENRIQR